MNCSVSTCEGRTGEQKVRTDRNYSRQNRNKEMKIQKAV